MVKIVNPFFDNLFISLNSPIIVKVSNMPPTAIEMNNQANCFPSLLVDEK